MKRIHKVILLTLMIGLIPVSTILGQDKKNEQKIKVVIEDESGTKSVIDTTFAGDSMPGTITLKDGKVIVLGKSGSGWILKEFPEGKGKVFVSVTADDNGKESKEEKIIIMSSDSAEWKEGPAGEKGVSYAYSIKKNSGGKAGTKVIIASSGDKNIDLEGDNIIVSEGKIITKGDGKSYNVYVNTDESDSETDVTRYVVAKDGLVVTVEGKDEAKVKELIKDIQDKLGVKNGDEGAKETVKPDARKPVKNK